MSGDEVFWILFWLCLGWIAGLVVVMIAAEVHYQRQDRRFKRSEDNFLNPEWWEKHDRSKP